MAKHCFLTALHEVWKYVTFQRVFKVWNAHIITFIWCAVETLAVEAQMDLSIAEQPQRYL